MKATLLKLGTIIGAAFSRASLLAMSSVLWVLVIIAFAIYLLYDKTEYAAQTEGTVFVETPQIYTRERLVNDRFIQENWLRSVLTQEPDFSPAEVVSITERKARTVQSKADASPGSGAADRTGEAGTAPGQTETRDVTTQPRIPPPVNFLLRNAYRELIRSHLIENQLDDRHDIRGTTLYLLKFDMAIVPGNNTRKRAYVRARITRDTRTSAERSRQSPVTPAGSPPGEAPRPTAEPSSGKLDQPASVRPLQFAEDYFAYYIEHPQSFSGFVSPEDDPNLINWQLYDQWRRSLQERLNAALRDVVHRFDANEFRYNEYNDFLSMLAEKSKRDVYSSWAMTLSKLRDTRDKLRAKLRKDDVYLAEALDHKFHLAAKLLLNRANQSASVDSGQAVDSESLTKILEAEAPASSEDEIGLRAALYRYAMRRVGLALFGDPYQFEIVPADEKAGGRTITTLAYLRSRTLDRFVLMRLALAGPDARALPSIQVDRRFAELYSFDLEQVSKLFDETATDCKLAKLSDFEFRMVASYKAGADGATSEFGAYRRLEAADTAPGGLKEAVDWELPSYVFKGDNLRRAFSRPEASPSITKHGACLSSAKAISLPVGYLNFVGHILDMQTYTYATLPRIDLLVTDTSADTGRNEGLTANVPGTGGSVAVGNYYRRMIRAVDPKTSVVGFSESLAPGELKFGWIISPRADAGRPGDMLSYRPMQPTQRSLSALVTVPTWWNRALVRVTTGWIGDNGTLSEGTAFSYAIPLPIDYESLDAILVEPGRRESRRPSIALERLPDTIAVQACEKAEILVPGHRLWRSSVVVLGGQRANNVTVLPDMRGIIATFDSVARRDPSEDVDGSVRMLQVWTSEGVTGPVPVKIKHGNNACDRATLAQGTGPAAVAGAQAPR